MVLKIWQYILVPRQRWDSTRDHVQAWRQRWVHNDLRTRSHVTPLGVAIMIVTSMWVWPPVLPGRDGLAARDEIPPFHGNCLFGMRVTLLMWTEVDPGPTSLSLISRFSPRDADTGGDRSVLAA